MEMKEKHEEERLDIRLEKNRWKSRDVDKQSAVFFHGSMIPSEKIKKEI